MMKFFNMLWLSMLLIPSAFAGTTTAAGDPAKSGWFSVLPMLILLVAFMYLMVIRPQSKRAKEQKALMSNLKKGDEIVTIGGILGKIEKINDNFIVISVAEGVEITIQKNAIANILPKGTITAKN